MYKVYLINFGRELEQRFRSYPAAMAAAIETGFECNIMHKDRIIETVKSI